ncbi:MAG: histidinol-phosphate transaminase [Rhodospirillales bacterium]|nr:histidinol-phosphate transaminase [Rhodospirillales bacterium]
MTILSPRPGVLDISPYRAGDGVLPGFERPIRLASNEGALGPSPAAAAVLAGLGDDLHRYPDGGATRLRTAIGRRFGLDPERIVCGAGSDQLIDLLCRAYAGPGDEVLYSAHGFMLYPIVARAAGATPVAAPETDLCADVDALLARVTPRTRILFLANPNNPTGSCLPRQAVRRLRAGLPDGVLLVLDAAYAEYVDWSDYTAGADLVDAGDNVVMTRTFSKLYALSALRIGWAYCPPAVADVLNRVRAPFNVNAAGQAAAIAALGDGRHFDHTRLHTLTWREWLAERLRDKGLNVPRSHGNFVLAGFPAEPGRTAHDADDFLRAHGIIVRRQDPCGLRDWLRITIGTEQEMRAVADGLARFLDRR